MIVISSLEKKTEVLVTCATEFVGKEGMGSLLFFQLSQFCFMK